MKIFRLNALGAPVSGRWAREWRRTNVSTSAAEVRGSRSPEFFLYILNTKSWILVHSFAPKMGTTSVFIKIPMHRGNGDLE